jgi:hypothetical protein
VGEASSDSEVLRAFAEGARTGASDCLHIENEVLYASGWWTLAIRLDADVFLVRTDPHAVPTARVTEALQALLRLKETTEVTSSSTKSSGNGVLSATVPCAGLLCRRLGLAGSG